MYIPSADMHVLAFTPRQCNLVTHLSTWRVRIYPHASALTRRMWDNPATPTHPDMRRVSCGKSAQTTKTEVIKLCNIANGHQPINSAQRVLNNTEVKERNTTCRQGPRKIVKWGG